MDVAREDLLRMIERSSIVQLLALLATPLSSSNGQTFVQQCTTMAHRRGSWYVLQILLHESRDALGLVLGLNAWAESDLFSAELVYTHMRDVFEKAWVLTDDKSVLEWLNIRVWQCTNKEMANLDELRRRGAECERLLKEGVRHVELHKIV